MLTVDFVNAVSSLAKESLNLRTKDLGNGLMMHVLPGKDPKIIRLPANPLHRRVTTFDSFLNLIRTRKPFTENTDTTSPVDLVDQPDHEGAVVYYGDEALVYQESPGKQDQFQATFPLMKSKPFLWLVAAEKNGISLGQKDFVKLLRIIFRNCNAGTLLDTVRQLKFTSGAAATGNIQHGKQSLSREILEEVEASGKTIPEEVLLSVPVFDNLHFRGEIACAIEINCTEGSFLMTPFPGEITKLTNVVLAQVQQMIQEVGVAAYQGSVK